MDFVKEKLHKEFVLFYSSRTLMNWYTGKLPTIKSDVSLFVC